MGGYLNEGMMKMSLLMDLIHTDEVGSYHDMVRGKVCGYGKDDKKMTLQIKLAYMEDGKNILEDVWWIVPYQGIDYGIFFRPEIGDEVLVFFLGNHHRNAIAIGSLPSNESKLWEEVSEKNERKCIRSKGGNEIVFWDEENKNKLEIKNKKFCMAMLEESEEVSLADIEKENEVKVCKKEGEIHLNAKEKIVFTCGDASIELSKDGGINIKGKTLSIDGQKVEISAKNDVIMSGQKISVDAKLEANLKAKTKVSVGATGNTEIVGGLINIG